MEVVPFVHEGLGNSSYLAGLGNGDAVLVDPDRTAGRYFRAAEERGWRIIAALETHIHADFVTGAAEVIAATRAAVYVSHEAPMAYPHKGMRHGETLRLDGAEVEVIASPGHTPEHVSYVLRTGEGPPALFSGGALTAGSAARTDLLTPELTEPLTRAQFRTVHNAFKALPDGTLLLPTHGGGSFCTAGSSGERTSTLGRERESNPLLAYEDEDEFTRWFPTTFPGVPAYFAHMREVNMAGPRLRREIAMPNPLPPEAFDAAAKEALIVDVRPVDDYSRAHVPQSLSIVFGSSFATWLGWLAPLGTPLLFVLPPDADRGLVDAIVDESLLIGQERFAGWLEGGFSAWERAGLSSSTLEHLKPEVARDLAKDGATVVDVREADEYAAGHIGGALHIPLGRLQDELSRVPRDRPVLTYCVMGERSTTAASILERNGFVDVRNVGGGITAWRRAGMPVRG